MKNMYKNISLFLIIFMIMQLDYCAQAQQGNQEKEELMEFLLQQYNQQPDLEGIITLPTINKLLFLQNIIYLEKLLLKQPNPRENFINRLIEDGIRPLFRSIQVTNNAENTRFRLQKILQIIKLLQLEQKQEEQREQIQLISYNQEQIDLHLAQLIENFNQLAEEQVPQNNRMRQNTLQMLKHSILTMLKNINLREISKEVEAERLIRESYFSPEMQFTVLASVEKPFAINVVTGKVHDIPTVQNIIDAHAGNETLRMNALHAALEATRMALFAAGLDAAYGQTEYIFVAPTLSSEFSRTVSSTIGLQSSDFLMPQLDEDLIRLLHEKKQSIETELWQYFLTAAYVWSWIPTNLIKMFYLYSNTNPADVAAIRLEHINTYNFEDPRNIEIIPNNLLEQIIKNYDFKQKVQPDIAANLIFKQCFIMQQPTYDPFWKCIPKGEQITATNYIFDSFPDINMLCNEISQKVANRQINPQQARKKLFEVRKAIQTALYIANKKSTFYIGYVLPPAITQFLDGVTQKLITYDAKLRNLCKNPALGGTQADLQNDILWTRISIIAAGIATGAVIDATYGSGTSAKLIEKAAENTVYYAGLGIGNAIYYTGQGVIQGGYYGTKGALQGGYALGKGIAQGAVGLGKGVAQGSYNLLNSSSSSTNNLSQENIAQKPSLDIQEKQTEAILVNFIEQMVGDNQATVPHTNFEKVSHAKV